MVGPIAIDTPDYQRGVVSAQKLLGSFLASQSFATVGIPPNAESLIIVTGGRPNTTNMGVVGVTSASDYVGVTLPSPTGVGGTLTAVFDISNAVDSEVTIEWNAQPGVPWFAYTDSAVHVVADLSKLLNQLGQQYVIPSAPATGSGDHPPVELSTLVQTNVASGATFLSAPGAGQRYRIMWATVCNTTTGAEVQLYDSVNGAAFVQGGVGPAGTYGITDMKPSGKPLSTGAAILAYASAGNANGTIVYTAENV